MWGGIDLVVAHAPFPTPEALDVAVRGVMAALPAKSLLMVLSQGSCNVFDAMDKCQKAQEGHAFFGCKE